jgi:hypothetical protein
MAIALSILHGAAKKLVVSMTAVVIWATRYFASARYGESQVVARLSLIPDHLKPDT